jgi:hypothetical protein
MRNYFTRFGGFSVRRRTLVLRSAILVGAIATGKVYAQSEHYAPGSDNIRDLALSAPGFYGAVYNYGYLTNDLKGASGKQNNSITITGPEGRSATISLSVNVHLYELTPTFVWVPKKKVLGAKYGVMLAPSFSNASLSGLLDDAEGSGLTAHTGQFNLGDLSVSPFWLDWSGKHYDFSYNYSFYVPTGKYNIRTVALPVIGPVRVASPDNTGLGFWENQNQWASYWYPWANQRMAIENALTWEINQKRRSFDLTYGQYLTWNWGVSEYLPLKKDQSVLAEIGSAGYGDFQVSDNTGADSRNPGVHEKAYAAGIQAGITLPARMMVWNFHWFHEFSAVDRFQGTVLGLSFVARF